MIIRELWSREDGDALRRFAEAVCDDQLAHALMALERVPSYRVVMLQAQLDGWGDQLAARLKGSIEPFRQAVELERLLGDELGFIGDTDTYYHPDNCRITAVMRRRRGMPILLSAIWVLVGRRAGLVMDGVGMPGHFVVRVGGDTGILVDPYSGGSFLSRRDCRRIVERLSRGRLEWDEHFLEPTNDLLLIDRVVRNLTGAYARRSDDEALYRVARFQEVLRPDSALVHLELAELSKRVGAVRLAERYLNQVVTRFPTSKEADEARRRLTSMTDEPVLLN